MRVITPFTHLAPETTQALVDAEESFEAYYVGKDDEAYFRLLGHCWGTSWDFAIVEQDIVVAPDTLESFRQCPNAWCCAPYPYLASQTYHGLGCVRFRGSLLRQHPTVMEAVGLRCDPRHPFKHWCSLDAYLQRELHRRSAVPCRDHPPVGHLHTVPSHGCIDLAARGLTA